MANRPRLETKDTIQGTKAYVEGELGQRAPEVEGPVPGKPGIELDLKTNL